MERNSDEGRIAEEARVRDQFGRALLERAAASPPVADRRTDELRAFESEDGYLKIWRRVIRHGSVVGVTIGLIATLIALLEQLSGRALVTSETLAGVHPTALLTLVLLLLLGTAIVSLIETPVSPWRRRLADLLAGLVCLLALAGFAAILLLGDPVAWRDTGFFRDPSMAALLLSALVGVGLLAVDRSPPGSSVEFWLVLTIGLVAEVGFLSRGYRVPEVSETISLDLSLIGLFGGAMLIFAYLALRPRRGLAGFLGATGAGPAMARLLAPVVLAIPFVLTMGRELAGLALSEPSELIWLIDEIIVVTSLFLIVTYASRRLQVYFEDWREAADELSEQAGVLSAMAEGVALLKLEDERIVFTNPQFDRMHGYPPGAMLGESIHIIRPPDSTAEEVQDWRRVGRELLEDGRTEFETRSLRRDGTIIWCRSTSILTNDPRHGPVMIIVRSDITTEREAKEAGAVAEARFRQVFEQSPIGLALVRPDGGFERVNRTFEEITGYPAAELEGMTFGEITHPDDLAEDVRQVAATFRGEIDGYQLEKRYIRKDGATVRVDLSVVMLRDESEDRNVALGMVQDVTERHELSRKLRFLADHDPLTGLFNRRRFSQELAGAVAAADGETGRGIAVMVIDIDNFKYINDRYGHTVGDRVIVQTGEVLRARMRIGDVIARQGGDEFVLLLTDIELGAVPGLAEDLVREISSKSRTEGPGFLPEVTVSIGVAVSIVLGSEDPERLIGAADLAMYEAKDAGRNGFRIFEPGERSGFSRGVNWFNRIREALDRDEFTLYCQPLVSLKGDPTPQFELLLRLPAPDREPVSPNAFMPVAERHNLVGEIDRWVARQAISMLRECGPSCPTRLFVNLSGQSVGDMELVAMIEDELHRAGVDPGRLVFEITETSAIADIDRARRFTSEMSRVGCQMALDDFGAGFASFYYLKHVAADYIKIDGEFIRNLVDDPTSQHLVRALTDLGRGLGKRVVAEHLEDQAAIELLVGYGVDYVQGFHFGHPGPATIETLTAARELGPAG